TEIDWSTYMQQVECFLGGTLDYEAIKGDTGPIVYPAGHLYLYTLLYYITGRGRNIYLGQCIFALLYLLMMGLVFSLYTRHSQVPPYVLIFMVFTSHRVHSLFMLRLFNDPVAMLFLYGSLVAFTRRKWATGSVLFSLAVSIKMNILLFAPALFLLLVESHSARLTGVLKSLSVCAAVQLLLGLPFLATHPLAYLRSAFNLGRVFLHQWTVNYRFLPEALFTSSTFHLSLLAVHITALVLFFWPRWISAFRRLLLSCTGREAAARPSVTPSSQNILLTMFTANLIGVAFSRSLHYQFYVWYYHSLPALLWATRFSPLVNICIWGLVELCWNVYPSTAWSSALLHAMHLLLLLGLFANRSANGLAAVEAAAE
ncbi:PREDICTED: lethal(2)neighbour of Tid protein-like, partial [Rhagoletis zephyria]|uniref:lethal(2)neighbour of Tid protein-like n=1 Tax=Rhagoletis zephyria TaxID=28612 RepID=UPI0008113159